jgi:hypothetical protein
MDEEEKLREESCSPTKQENQSNAAESDMSGMTSILNQNFTEEDLYYLNGLTKLWAKSRT